MEQWGVNVPNIPNWVDTTRAPEQIRKQRFLASLQRQLGEHHQSHPHGNPREEMRAWLEHDIEDRKERDQQFHHNASAGLNYLVRVLREPFVDQWHPVCLQLQVSTVTIE